MSSGAMTPPTRGGYPGGMTSDRAGLEIPGYQGHVPGRQSETAIGGTFRAANHRAANSRSGGYVKDTSMPNSARDNYQLGDMPLTATLGYSGHVPGKDSEAVYGRNFRNAMKQGVQEFTEGNRQPGFKPFKPQSHYKRVTSPTSENVHGRLDFGNSGYQTPSDTGSMAGDIGPPSKNEMMGATLKIPRSASSGASVASSASGAGNRKNKGGGSNSVGAVQRNGTKNGMGADIPRDPTGRPEFGFATIHGAKRPGFEIPGYSGHIPGGSENVIGKSFKAQNEHQATALFQRKFR